MQSVLKDRTLRLLIITLGAAVFTAACGEADSDDPNGDDNGDNGMTAEEEACLHAQEDTPLPRTATLEMDDADGDIGNTHLLYEITLAENTDGDYEGYLEYDVDAGSYALFTSIDVDVVFTDDAGDHITPDVSDVDECVEIAQRHDVELDGIPLLVRFGPTSTDQLYTVTERVD